MQTVAQAIAVAVTAKANCEKSGNAEWLDRWEDRIDALMKDAPSGSGIDSGTQLLDATSKRITLKTAYHHMNEHGYYMGWTHHNVIVEPAFEGVSIRITGRDHRDIKDYLGDLFAQWLTSEAPAMTAGEKVTP